MNVSKMIAELRQERACLDEVIVGLEKLLRQREPRRGRPPLRLKVTYSDSINKNGKIAHVAQ